MASGQELVLADLHPSLKSGAIWGDAWREFMGVGTEGSGSVREFTGTKGDYNRAFFDAWIYRCIDVRGGAMTQAPLKVYAPRKGGKRRQEVDHDALDVIKFTNPMGWLCGDLLLQATLASEDLHGHYCWQLAFGKNNLPTEIYLWPPGAYEPVGDKDGFFRGIKVKDQMDNAKEKVISKQELVYDVSMSLIDPVKGTSKIRAAQMDLNLKAYGAASNLWFLRNNMRPDWLLTGDFAPTQENVDKIRRLINQWAGGDNRRGPLILGGGSMQAHLLTVDRKDAEWVQQQRLSQETLAGIFGVPMTMMNVLENATLANVEALNVIFWKDTMFPELKRMADGLTRNFLWRWPDARRAGLEFGFDLAAIEGLGEDIGKIWERFISLMAAINKQVQDGTMVPNQARLATADLAESLGIDPTPWNGEVPQGADRMINWNFIPSGQASLGAVIDIMAARGPNAAIIQDLPGAEGFEAPARELLQDVAERAQAESVAKPPTKSSNKRTIDATPSEGLQEAREAASKAGLPTPDPVPPREARLQPIQQKTVKRLKKYFQGLQTQTLRELRKRQPQEMGRNAEGLRLVAATAGMKADRPNEPPYDQDQSQQDLFEILGETVELSGQAAYTAAAQDFGLINAVWDVTNPWLPAYMGQRSQLIKGIDWTTINALNDTLTEGGIAGESIPQLSERVTTVFKEAIDSRAVMIARTETLQAYGSASLQAYRQAGIQRAKMYDGPNADSADCITVAGQVVSLEEAAKLMGEEHPNGTRGVAPYFEPSDPILPIQDFPAKVASAPLPSPKSEMVQIAEMFAMAIKANGELVVAAIRAMPGPADVKIDLPQPAPITVTAPPVTVTFEKGSIQNDIHAPTTIAEGAMKTTIEKGAIDARTSIEKGAIDARTTIAEGAVKAETHVAPPQVTIAEGAIKASTTISKGAIEAPITVNVPEPDIEIEYNKGTGEAKRKK